jgi:hypothetical protein
LRRRFRGRGASRPGEATHRWFSLAGIASLSRLGADNRGFDHHVVRPADHQEMLDIIAAHDDELPLPVDLEGIYDAEALLAAATTWQFDAASEHNAEQHENQRYADEEAHGRQNEGERAVLSENAHKGHVLVSHRSAAKRIKLS